MLFSSFSVGPLEFSFGEVVLLAFCGLAALMLCRTARDEEVSLRFLSEHLLLLVALPIAFGRLGAMIDMWPSIAYRLPGGVVGNSWEVIRSFLFVGDGGLRATWVLGGLLLTFFVLALLRGERKRAWLDVFALPAVIFAAGLSFGGFFSGWGHGVPVPDGVFAPFPFAVSYDLLTVRYSGPVYAVPLFAGFGHLLLLAVGLRAWRQKIFQKWPRGRFFCVMVGGMLLVEGIAGFFRADGGGLLGLRLGAAAMLLGAAICFLAALALRTSLKAALEARRRQFADRSSSIK